MEEFANVSTQVLFTSSLVWAITQVLKQVLQGVNPQVLCFVIAGLLGAIAYFTGYLVGPPLEQIGLVILTGLGASAEYNYLYKPGLGGGGAK